MKLSGVTIADTGCGQMDCAHTQRQWTVTYVAWNVMGTIIAVMERGTMNRPKAEVKAEQDYIAKHHNLGWWYGTGCKTCCGVYPKFMTVYTPDMPCYFQCEVCGKRTENFNMPWQAEEAWNSGETFYPDRRISLFELEEE